MLGGGISSAAIWTAFDAVTTAVSRIIKWALNISWLRVQDADAGFAYVGTSLIGGTDILQGEGVSAVTNLDTFEYFDETDRLVELTYDRKIIEPTGGMSTGMLDVVLENTDDRFTPDKNATIGTALLPKRPTNAAIGFVVQGQDKTITVFKGLTGMPQADLNKRTVNIPAQDYVSYLDNIPLDGAKYVDQRSDQIIGSILSDLGFGTSQYSLDTGLNTIGFAYWDKGVSAGYRIRQICEAEEAVFYQDENGILRFETRQHYNLAPHNSSVWTIDTDDIIEWEELRNVRIINKVVVKAAPRVVLGSNVGIWSAAEVYSIPGSGGSITVWADFQDPVNSIVAPVENTDYDANTASDGSGSDISSDISIVLTNFTKAAKMVITNANASTAYLVDSGGSIALALRGDPAQAVDKSTDPPTPFSILETYEDADSINKFDEQEYILENNFIDSSSHAAYIAQALVEKYKDPFRRIRIRVQGIPQIQLRDWVKVRIN